MLIVVCCHLSSRIVDKGYERFGFFFTLHFLVSAKSTYEGVTAFWALATNIG